MAQTLSDVIQRRTSLGTAGLPDDIAIEQCVALMTAELNWTPERCAQEVEAVYAAYGQQTPQPVHNDLFLYRNGRHTKESLALVAVPIT
jgi:glycerol-3-phosphate dehydrogenase